MQFKTLTIHWDGAKIPSSRNLRQRDQKFCRKIFFSGLPAAYLRIDPRQRDQSFVTEFLGIFAWLTSEIRNQKDNAIKNIVI